MAKELHVWLVFLFAIITQFTCTCTWWMAWRAGGLRSKQRPPPCCDEGRCCEPCRISKGWCCKRGPSWSCGQLWPWKCGFWCSLAAAWQVQDCAGLGCSCDSGEIWWAAPSDFYQSHLGRYHGSSWWQSQHGRTFEKDEFISATMPVVPRELSRRLLLAVKKPQAPTGRPAQIDSQRVQKTYLLTFSNFDPAIQAVLQAFDTADYGVTACESMPVFSESSRGMDSGIFLWLRPCRNRVGGLDGEKIWNAVGLGAERKWRVIGTESYLRAGRHTRSSQPKEGPACQLQVWKEWMPDIDDSKNGKAISFAPSRNKSSGYQKEVDLLVDKLFHAVRTLPSAFVQINKAINYAQISLGNQKDFTMIFLKHLSFAEHVQFVFSHPQ